MNCGIIEPESPLMSDRLNSEGIQRHKLIQALGERRVVLSARRIDSCLLCRAHNVNEAGLCAMCWSQLTDEEIALGQRWLIGQGP